MPEDGANFNLGALRSSLCVCPSSQLLELYLCSCPVPYPPLLPKEIDLKIQVCDTEGTVVVSTFPQPQVFACVCNLC